MPKQEHARTQAISSLVHHQQLELPPCIHQKEGCGAIENSTLPQCPCWTDWEIHQIFRVQSHTANDHCVPRRYVGSAECEPKRKSLYRFVARLRTSLLLLVATTSPVKVHQSWTPQSWKRIPYMPPSLAQKRRWRGDEYSPMLGCAHVWPCPHIRYLSYPMSFLNLHWGEDKGVRLCGDH